MRWEQVSEMWRGLNLAVYGLSCVAVGYFWGLIDAGSPTSMVLSVLRQQVDASTGPFVCTLGQHGNVRRYLHLIGVQTNKFDDVFTVDDRNMLVVFDGRELTAVEFTTFKHSFSEEKCSQIWK